MRRPPAVLFVCLHGSAKSLIALEHFRRLAREQGVDVQADAAGLEPDADVPPGVVQGLLGDGIDVRGCRPRRVTREDVAHATRVVTFGCQLGDLGSPGVEVDRWDDVPAVSDDFRKARDVIVVRLGRLLDELAA